MVSPNAWRAFCSHDARQSSDDARQLERTLLEPFTISTAVAYRQDSIFETALTSIAFLETLP